MTDKPKNLVERTIDKFVASAEVSSNRLSICDKCPSLRSPGHICNECGCLMQIKTKLLTSACPLGKW